MIEDVIKKLKTYLVNYLTIKFDDQDTKYVGESDAFSMRDVNDDDIFIGDRKSIQNTPFLILSPVIINDIKMHFNNIMDYPNRFRIVFGETDTKPYRLERRMYRAARAIENVFESTFQQWSVYFMLYVDNIDFQSSYYQPDTSDLYREITINMTVVERLLKDDEYQTIFPYNRIKLDWSGNEIIYKGWHVLNDPSDSDTGWYIKKNLWSNGKKIESQILKGAWSNRTNLNWNI